MTINKNRFYAIKELNTGLFLDYGTVIPKFYPLGERTKLYDSMADAMERIERGDLNYLMYFDNLEKFTGIDRWHADIDYDDFTLGVSEFKFKVVPIEVQEITD